MCLEALCYVLEQYIEDIQFFEVNTNYISSGGEKISTFHERIARVVISKYQPARDEIYLVFDENKK